MKPTSCKVALLIYSSGGHECFLRWNKLLLTISTFHTTIKVERTTEHSSLRPTLESMKLEKSPEPQISSHTSSSSPKLVYNESEATGGVHSTWIRREKHTRRSWTAKNSYMYPSLQATCLETKSMRKRLLNWANQEERERVSVMLIAFWNSEFGIGETSRRCYGGIASGGSPVSTWEAVGWDGRFANRCQVVKRLKWRIIK